MKYYLYIWIMGCAGFNCEIPSHIEKEFSSLADCEVALMVAKSMHEDQPKAVYAKNKHFAGICLPEDAHERVQAEWADKEVG